MLCYILKKSNKIVNYQGFILIIPILLLASTYFIFYNLLFRSLNILAITLLVTIMCLWVTKKELKLPKLILKGLNLIFAPFIYFGKVLEEVKVLFANRKENGKVKSIIKSILIALPIVLIVFILLMSADEIFADLFSGITNYFEKMLQINELISLVLRIAVIVFLVFYFSSFCYNLTSENTSYAKEYNINKKLKIQSTTINIIYTMLNIIYLIFSIIQFTYLFTKAGISPDFDYANYARQGFFQLMFVSLINFGMIFVTQINKAEQSQKEKLYQKIMTIATAIFTGIIIVSAFMRMNLYEAEFGYTYLRLFVYVILITEFVLLIPTIAYLVNNKINMLKTTLLIVTTSYVILNYMNIDKIIATKNVNRYIENPEKELDFTYLKRSTGIDAIPELIPLLDIEDEILKRNVIRYLEDAKEQINVQDRTWQDYNISENKAKETLNEIKLEEVKNENNWGK